MLGPVEHEHGPVGGVRPASSRQPLVWLAIVVAASFLGWRAYDGVASTRELTSATSTMAAATAYRHLQCLDDAVHQMVPSGRKVFIDMGDLPSLVALAAAFPDREIVGTAAEADVVFGLSVPPAPDLCSAGAFRTTPLGRP